MEEFIGSTGNEIIDVRYSKRHWISMFIAAAFFLILPIMVGYHDLFWLIYAIVFILIFAGQGLYALKGGKSMRLDRKNKILYKYIVYGLASWKYKYDRLFFRGRLLYREINGKTKFIEIRSMDYNKDDLEVLISEINKG